MGASEPTKRALAFRSGNRCAFPGCSVNLILDDDGDPNQIGEAAHIYGEKDIAARYESTLTDEQRNHYDNLMYLCPNHHTEIDKNGIKYTAELLLQWKDEHETKARSSIERGFAEVSFKELEEATQWATEIEPTVDEVNFSLLAIDEKIIKNGLSSKCKAQIIQGLSVTPLIGRFIEQKAKLDLYFPERLKIGFLSQYYDLVNQGAKGENLFELMCEFTTKGLQEPTQRSAAIAVMIYLFEKCDIFEK